MLVNYPHRVLTHPAPETLGPRSGAGLLALAAQGLRHWLCGLQGHDRLLRFDAGRMYLHCMSCGHKSPGWEIGPERPQLRYAGDPERHALRRPVREPGPRPQSGPVPIRAVRRTA